MPMIGGKLGKGNMLGGVEWNRYTLYDSEYLEGMNLKRSSGRGSKNDFTRDTR